MRHARLGRLAALAVRSSIQLLVIIAALGTSAVVRAQDDAQAQEWPRFHFGVAVGSPDDWSVDISEAGVPFPDPILEGNRLAEPDTGWKLVAGFPLRVVGVELQFIDFGEGDAGVNGRILNTAGESQASGSRKPE